MEDRSIDEIIDQAQRTEKLRQYDLIESALIVSSYNMHSMFTPILMEKWRG